MDSEFEKRVSSRPLKQVPGEWRAEILAVARGEQTARHSSFVIRHSWFSNFNRQLSALLWPHPKAWAGLAAVWIFVFILNFSMRDHAPALAEKSQPPSTEMVAELRRQQKMLAELIGATEVRVADRQPVFSPKPRSERVILAG